MDKKLPKVFANKVEKNAGNNKNVFYSGDDRNDYSNETDFSLQKSSQENNFKDKSGPFTKNINQKIKEIFNSSNYIYKADVELTLKSGKVIKRIIGKNANNLITMDNELIPISEIIDIKRQ